MLNVFVDLDNIRKRLPTEKLAKTVLSRAIHRAITAGRTQAGREVAKRYAMRQGRVSERARVTKKPSATDPAAVLQFAGPSLNITDYRVSPGKPDPARRPVLRVMISKGGMRPMRGPFLLNLRPGSVKAFKREGRARYPIRPVFGPSIPQLVGSEQVSEAVIDRMVEVMDKRLDHEVNRKLLEGAR